MKKKLIIKFLLFIFFICFIACKKNSENKLSHTALSGKALMVFLLDSVVKLKNPPDLMFNNSLNAQYFEQKVRENSQSFDLRVRYAVELLFAGDTEKSIAELKLLYEFLKSSGQMRSEDKVYLLKLLAIASLRLGEQENCLNHHSAQSCLLPIQGDGIHQLKEGSETGIVYLKELLKENPNDLTSIWLLNIASMTIGIYPKGVPKEFLIPPSKFANKIPFPKFMDIAMNYNTAINETSGGIAVEDFDHDGYLDIIATGWGLKESIKFLHYYPTKYLKK